MGDEAPLHHDEEALALGSAIADAVVADEMLQRPKGEEGQVSLRRLAGPGKAGGRDREEHTGALR